MEKINAKGAQGHLLYIHSANTYVFRVYGPNHTFVDYDIRHSDLLVTISDDDAFFYRSKDNDILDHAPATLGISS